MYNLVILPKCVHLQLVVLLLYDQSFSPLVCFSMFVCLVHCGLHLCRTLYQ